MRRRVLLATAMVSGALFGVALAGGGTAVIPGSLGLHGNAADPPSGVVVDSGVGGEVKRVTELIPNFSYVAPTGGTTMGTSLTSGTTLTDGTYHYTGLTLGAGQTLTISGGGTVRLHVPAATLDGATVSLQDGTKLIIYSDSTVAMTSVTWSGSGQVQVQAAGKITVKTNAFTGAALANNKLTLEASALSSIVLDDSLLTVSQDGASRKLKILPISER